MAPGDEQNAIAIHELSRCARENRAVRVAVKGHPERRTSFDYAFLHTLRIERAAARIDVAAVGRIIHGHDASPERTKQLGCKFASRAIGAIQDDFQAREFRSRQGCSAKSFEVIRTEPLAAIARYGRGVTASWRRAIGRQ